MIRPYIAAAALIGIGILIGRAIFQTVVYVATYKETPSCEWAQAVIKKQEHKAP